MKKSLIISLFVLLTLGLFVSCKPEPEPEPEKAKKTFAEILAMADNFPTSTDVAWEKNANCKCCLGEYKGGAGCALPVIL